MPAPARNARAISRSAVSRAVVPAPFRERVGKPADAERPDVGELRRVERLGRHDDHRGLQFVHGARERRAVLDARLDAQIGRRHLPLAAQHLQDRPRVPAQPPLLVRLAHAPDRVEVRNHARREEHRFAARQLGVVDLAARHDLVLQRPRQRRLGILLDVARHHRVAAAAHRDVERRPGPAAVGHAGREADVLDEALGVERGLDLARGFTAPSLVAMVLELLRDLRPSSHHPRPTIDENGRQSQGVDCLA